MIRWINNKLFERRVDEDEYPKWSEVTEDTATKEITSYEVKVVWKDGTEEVMECDALDTDDISGELQLKYVTDAWRSVDGEGEPYLNLNYEPKDI